MKILVLANNMGLVREVKTIGAVANKNGKPSTDKVYFAKQNAKPMMTIIGIHK